MEPEIDLLVERANALIALARRLGEENTQLRDQLARSQSDREQMRTRMHEARARVESALARLPVAIGQAR